MKRLYIFNLLFFLGLHVFGPLVYYYCIRGQYIFSYGLNCPDKYIFRAAVIISAPIIFTIIVILKAYKKKDYVAPVLNRRMSWWFIIAWSINMLKLNFRGDYSNYAAVNGTIWAYTGVFLNLGVLLILIYLLSKENENIILIGVLYILCSIAASSRSGALNLVFALILILFTTHKYIKIRKWIIMFITVVVLFSPLLFRIATTQRGSMGKSGIDLMDQIVGRCSYLELVAGPLYQKDHNLWEQEIFEEKYSLLHQAKLCVNSVVPGDIFEQDVHPNQYYRAIFMGYSIEQCQKSYTSILLTLPGYLYIKYGGIMSFICTFIILMTLFAFGYHSKKKGILSVLILTYITSVILDYFDTAYTFNDVKGCLLTGLAFYLSYRVIKRMPKIVFIKHAKSS